MKRKEWVVRKGKIKEGRRGGERQEKQTGGKEGKNVAVKPCKADSRQKSTTTSNEENL